MVFLFLSIFTPKSWRELGLGFRDGGNTFQGTEETGIQGPRAFGTGPLGIFTLGCTKGGFHPPKFCQKIGGLSPWVKIHVWVNLRQAFWLFESPLDIRFPGWFPIRLWAIFRTSLGGTHKGSTLCGRAPSKGEAF